MRARGFLVIITYLLCSYAVVSAALNTKLKPDEHAAFFSRGQGERIHQPMIADGRLEMGTERISVNQNNAELPLNLVTVREPGQSNSLKNGYGYYWTDSDTNLGVSYNWIEISNIGISIEPSQWRNDSLPGSSQDDGTAGPFALGFSFPYCEDSHDSVWIGTNGLISFSTRDLTIDGYFGVLDQDFELPYFNFPVALVGYYIDLVVDSAGGDRVYYWQNAQKDTFVVQYDGVHVLGAGATVTMEIVISLSDSTITYQYKTLSGSRPAIVGLQDRSKAVGLEYYYYRSSGYPIHEPVENRPHDGLAVRFRRDAVVADNIYILHPRYSSVTRDGGAGLVGVPYQFPFSSVLNTGTTDRPVVTVEHRISEIASVPPIYNWSKQNILNDVASYDSAAVVPSPEWVPEQRGKYSSAFQNTTVPDEIETDDSVSLGSIYIERRILESNWARITPVIDGSISPGEWSDAATYDVSAFALGHIVYGYIVNQSRGAAVVHLKNDSTQFYILLELLADSTQSQLDMARFDVDDDLDSMYAPDSSEGRYGIIHLSDHDSTYFRPSLPNLFDPYFGYQLPSYYTNGFQGKFGINQGHVVVEAAIPFGTDPVALNRSGPGKKSGFTFGYFDWADSLFDGVTWLHKGLAYWPYYNNVYVYPRDFGIISFADFYSACGDVDDDGSISIADVVFLINYIFVGGAAPQPLSLGDVDCSGGINIADAVRLVNYIFSGGPPPCAGCK